VQGYEERNSDRATHSRDGKTIKEKARRYKGSEEKITRHL
jgi:hypothetical protein